MEKVPDGTGPPNSSSLKAIKVGEKVAFQVPGKEEDPSTLVIIDLGGGAEVRD